MSENLDTAFEAEVRALHVVIENWLAGRVTKDAESLAPFSAALAPDFMIISPRGTATERDALLAEFETAHASRKDVSPEFRIRIENCRLRFSDEHTCLGTYEEWQQGGTTSTARLSTVLFRRDAGARNGLLWQHLHETWLAGHAPVEQGTGGTI